MQTAVYRDVAVGVDPGGAEAWSDQSLLVSSASVGAPPDIYNSRGQDWGLVPFSPLALRARAYQPLIETVRANMRHAGALRIDHVLGLKRLWWVPRNGAGAQAGGYIQYPFDDVIGIIALESQRHRCFVVGEDLGTVPEGFREEMQRRRILSYRLLIFEREGGDGDFLPPGAYPVFAAAAVSTHDLPTLRGLWQDRDLSWRRKLGLLQSAEAVQKECAAREQTRERLLQALCSYAGLPSGAAARLRASVQDRSDEMQRLAEAAHRFLARVPSRWMLVQLEDLVGEVDQMNLPGTVNEHPNWRRKLRLANEAICSDELVRRTAQIVDDARRKPL
jgi:4-alpha-glucanotransferase